MENVHLISPVLMEPSESKILASLAQAFVLSACLEMIQNVKSVEKDLF